MIERDGIPLDTIRVAAFRAPRQVRPAKPLRLRLVRRKTGVVVAWDRTPGASSYNLSIAQAGGERYARTLRPGCRAALLRRPRPGERVSVQVVGMRSDLETGPAARVTLRTKAYRAGTRPRGRGRWAPLRTCG